MKEIEKKCSLAEILTHRIGGWGAAGVLSRIDRKQPQLNLHDGSCGSNKERRITMTIGICRYPGTDQN